MAFHLLILATGLSIGSFANVCIHRLPRGESVITGRSACPRCMVTIRVADLIPVVSFMLLAGKCRECKRPIPWHYPITELTVAGAFLLIYRNYELSPVSFVYAGLSVLLVIAAGIDIKIKAIPNVLILIGLLGWGLALLFCGLQPGEGIAGAVIAGTLMLAIRWLGFLLYHKPGMGLGDVKLSTVLGLLLGPIGVINLVFWAILAGSIFGIIAFGCRRLARYQQLPFAPFLAFALIPAIFEFNFTEYLIGILT